MRVLGLGADDTTNVQLNKQPYLEDVGRRSYTDSHEQYEWYPGDRRVYQAIEDRFDFAQQSHPNQFLQLYKIRVRQVNTLNTPRGEKKAYVALSKDQDALDIANKIGIM